MGTLFNPGPASIRLGLRAASSSPGTLACESRIITGYQHHGLALRADAVENHILELLIKLSTRIRKFQLNAVKV